MHRGIITRKIIDNPAVFSDRYRPKAYRIINSILTGGASPASYISSRDLKRLDTWEKANRKPTEKELLSMFLAMAKKSGKKKKNGEEVKASFNKSQDEMKKLIIAALPYKEKKKYILKLKEEESFKKASGILDPEKREKAKNLASFIPAMKKTMAIALQDDMMRLVELMQDKKLRSEAFQLLENSEVLENVKKKQAEIENKKAERMLSRNVKSSLFLVMNKNDFLKQLPRLKQKKLKEVRADLDFYLENRATAVILGNQKGADAKAITAILKSDSSIKMIEKRKAELEKRIAALDEKEKEYVFAVRTLKNALFSVRRHYTNLSRSSAAELKAVQTALNGGYIAPSSGGDAVFNPEAVPTGRNIYAIDAEKTPTEEAWKAGKKLAVALLDKKKKETGKFPRKVAFTLWGGEFIRAEGITLGEIFYLLGVEPVRNSSGVVHDVKLIPTEQLKRPRIDVVVQTSGQFRDIAASRIYLINNAVKLAAEAPDSKKYPNYVKEGNIDAERVMKEKGMSPKEARSLAGARVFGGVNGNYGTGIMGLVESGDKWEKDSELADRYLKNMGAVYTRDRWGYYQPGILEGALQKTDTVVQPSSSNMSGTLSLDHVYEFMGGINATIRNVTGNDPDAYINDIRNKHNATVQGLKDSIAVESRATLMNPKYIKDLMAGGSSSAEEFAETFRNTYAWNVMKPSVIDNELWDNLHQVYVKDSYKLGVKQFFKNKNPYALQEMTAVMLETIRKGYWKPSEGVKKEIAQLHAQLVKDHRAGCSGFVCDNAKLREMIAGQLDEKLKDAYQKQITEVRVGTSENVEGMKLKKETKKLKPVTELLKENKGAVAAILMVIAMIGFLVLFGIYKKRKEQNM